MIDIADRGSPGYWLNRCAKELTDPARQKRLQGLYDRLHGDPPLPEGSENVREAYLKVQRKARTNYEELIVQAAAERMKVGGVRTAAADDDNGDKVAQRVLDENAMQAQFADAFGAMLGLSESYMIVGPVDDDLKVPVITVEDPRQTITIHDPVQPRKILAGLKMFHDPEQDLDLAYLYLPGEMGIGGLRGNATVHKAGRKVKRYRNNQRIMWAPGQWDWLETEELNHSYPPIVRFLDRDGVGEFEAHTDTIDRIRHGILTRLVISLMQAYRQRAIKGELPTHDEAGNEIDYNEAFEGGPGALWLVPAGVELWESETTDLSPILQAVKDDIRDLAAVTRTPLSYLTPDAASQSAEGASLMREGLVFKVEDRIARATPSVVDVMHLSFLTMGDIERARRSEIEIMWVPPERQSLSERADAASKTQDMSARWRMEHIWGMTPSEIEAEMANRATDALFNEPAPLPVPAPAVA